MTMKWTSNRNLPRRQLAKELATPGAQPYNELGVRMTARVALLLGTVLVGCGGRDPAPPTLSESYSPEVLFLVRNEVLSIRLDGTNRRSLALVGDNRYRTGFPRFLPDGRVAVLADDTGGIFPFVGEASGKGGFTKLAPTNVTYHDALCGVRVGGHSRLIFTNTPWTPFLPLEAGLFVMDVDDPQLVRVHAEFGGGLSTPAPYDDGRVLVVRATRETSFQPGTATIEVLRADDSDDKMVLATLKPGYTATSPARLPDGRVVFIRSVLGGYSASDLGEMFVIERDGAVHSTNLTGVVALLVVGDRVVYEVGGMDDVSDLVMTDLATPPVNITNTRYVSEHLAWSD